jgi:hypothetical protein
MKEMMMRRRRRRRRRKKLTRKRNLRFMDILVRKIKYAYIKCS